MLTCILTLNIIFKVEAHHFTWHLKLNLSHDKNIPPLSESRSCSSQRSSVEVTPLRDGSVTQLCHKTLSAFMFFFWFEKFKFDFLPRSYHVQNVSSHPWLMLRGQRNRIHRGFTSMQTLAEVFLVQTITASDWALKCLFFIFIWFIGLCVYFFSWMLFLTSASPLCQFESHCISHQPLHFYLCVCVCGRLFFFFCPWNTTRSPRDPQTPRKGILGRLNLSP